MKTICLVLTLILCLAAIPAIAEEGEIMPTVLLTAGDITIAVQMEENPTSRDFLAQLPLTLTMARYDDREYYAAMPTELSNDAALLDGFTNGDFTYYTTGNSLAVFFGGDDRSSQSGLIRMGRVLTDLNVFTNLDKSVEFTIAEGVLTPEQEILTDLRVYYDAMENADIDTMSKYIADDATFTHMSGLTQTKDEYLADIASGELDYINISQEDVVITVEGDRATVSHTSVMEANAYGAYGTYRMGGTSHLVKQNGLWVRGKRPAE